MQRHRVVVADHELQAAVTPLYLDSDGSSERAAARDALRSRDRGRAWGAAPSFRHEPEQLRGSEPESQGWDAATSRTGRWEESV